MRRPGHRARVQQPVGGGFVAPGVLVDLSEAVADLAEPGSFTVPFLDHAGQRRGNGGCVGADERIDARVCCGRCDIHLEDLRRIVEEVAEAHGELVQLCAKHQDGVCLVDQRRGLLGGEASGDAQVAVAGRQEVCRQHGAGAQGAELVGERADCLGGVGKARAAPVEDQWTFGRAQCRCGLGQQFRRRHGVSGIQVEVRERQVRLVCRFVGHDVIGQGDDNGYAFAQCMGHRREGDCHGVLRVNHKGLGADCGVDCRLVHVPGAGAGGWLVAGHQDHGDSCCCGFGQRGDGVGESGPVGGCGNRRLAGDPEVGVGGGDCGRFVADGGEAESGANRGVKEVCISVAHDPEDFGGAG